MEPPVDMIACMTLFYADTSGKSLPAMIWFGRNVTIKHPDAAARAKHEAEIIAAAGGGVAFTDFPTSAGNWRRLTQSQNLTMPVGDARLGPKEMFPSRTDTYVLMTTNETLTIIAAAPSSVTNTFDFFGEVEVGLRAMTAGPPALTGTVP
jgi:hypothetical protein